MRSGKGGERTFGAGEVGDPGHRRGREPAHQGITILAITIFEGCWWLMFGKTPGACYTTRVVGVEMGANLSRFRGSSDMLCVRCGCQVQVH